MGEHHYHYWTKIDDCCILFDVLCMSKKRCLPHAQLRSSVVLDFDDDTRRGPQADSSTNAIVLVWDASLTAVRNLRVKHAPLCNVGEK